MKISEKKVVVMTYTLMVEGQIADRATKEQPFDYIQGVGMVLPSLEAALEGLEPGATFTVSIPAAEGYGEYDKSLCFDIPKSSFTLNGVLREDLLVPGRVIPMLGPDGNAIRAKIVEVKEDTVTVDFNDPMAGKVLNFTGEVLSVREATDKELTEGLHGEFLPHECHCGGGCHGGCHHDGEKGHECNCGCEDGEHECKCGGEGGCGCGHNS